MSKFLTCANLGCSKFSFADIWCDEHQGNVSEVDPEHPAKEFLDHIKYDADVYERTLVEFPTVQCKRCKNKKMSVCDLCKVPLGEDGTEDPLLKRFLFMLISISPADFEKLQEVVTEANPGFVNYVLEHRQIFEILSRAMERAKFSPSEIIVYMNQNKSRITHKGEISKISRIPVEMYLKNYAEFRDSSSYQKVKKHAETLKIKIETSPDKKNSEL